MHPRGSHTGTPRGHFHDTITGKQRAQARRALDRRLALAGTPAVMSGATSDEDVVVDTELIQALAHVDHLRVTADEVAAARHPAAAPSHKKSAARGSGRGKRSKAAPARRSAAATGSARRAQAASPPPSIAVGYSRRAGSTKASDQRVALVSCDTSGCTIRGGPARVKVVASEPCGVVGVPTVCDAPESATAVCSRAAGWGGADASLYSSSVVLNGAPAQFGAPLAAACKYSCDVLCVLVAPT